MHRKNLQKSIKEKDAKAIEEILISIQKNNIPIENFKDLFLELLLEKWHFVHQDIVMLLGEIADSSMNDALLSATELKLDYLDYDDTYQLARKAIKILSKIGNKSSIEKLKIIEQFDNQVISDYAKKELKKR